MPESISDLLALVVSLVVLYLLSRSHSRDEQLGRGHGIEMHHEQPVKVSTVDRPRSGRFGGS